MTNEESASILPLSRLPPVFLELPTLKMYEIIEKKYQILSNYNQFFVKPTFLINQELGQFDSYHGEKHHGRRIFMFFLTNVDQNTRDC